MIFQIAAFILVILSFFLGKTYESSIHRDDSIEMDRLVSSSGSLTNPLLECEMSTYGSTQRYLPFEDEVKKKITTEVIEKNRDVSISVYFRNLRNGPWFGMGEDAEFAPASLMKLPVTMAYAKWSEEIPDLLTLSLTGVSEDTTIQNITPSDPIIPGSLYTIDTLIRHALVQSDNVANQTLLSYIPTDVLFRVFRDLSIPVEEEIRDGKDDYISVKEYASFFRILYNASYLSQAKSEYLLGVMSESVDTPGIRETIPDDIIVAHKFGERRMPTSS